MLRPRRGEAFAPSSHRSNKRKIRIEGQRRARYSFLVATKPATLDFLALLSSPPVFGQPDNWTTKRGIRTRAESAPAQNSRPSGKRTRPASEPVRVAYPSLKPNRFSFLYPYHR